MKDDSKEKFHIGDETVRKTLKACGFDTNRTEYSDEGIRSILVLSGVTSALAGALIIGIATLFVNPGASAAYSCTDVERQYKKDTEALSQKYERRIEQLEDVASRRTFGGRILRRKSESQIAEDLGEASRLRRDYESALDRVTRVYTAKIGNCF